MVSDFDLAPGLVLLEGRKTPLPPVRRDDVGSGAHGHIAAVSRRGPAELPDFGADRRGRARSSSSGSRRGGSTTACSDLGVRVAPVAELLKRCRRALYSRPVARRTASGGRCCRSAFRSRQRPCMLVVTGEPAELGYRPRFASGGTQRSEPLLHGPSVRRRITSMTNVAPCRAWLLLLGCWERSHLLRGQSIDVHDV